MPSGEGHLDKFAHAVDRIVFLMGSDSSTTRKQGPSRPKGSIVAEVLGWPGATGETRFSEDFIIGSDVDCEVRIPTPKVSPQHVQVFFDGAAWWVRDLGS